MVYRHLEAITHGSYTSDPSLVSGQVWYRSDTKQIRGSNDGSSAFNMGPYGYMPTAKTGVWYYVAPVNTTNATSLAMTLSVEYATPIILGFGCTVSGIACNVATAGGSSNVLRAGIRADSGGLEPASAAPVLDAGTVVSTSLGVKTWTPSQALQAGIYWITISSQVGTACAVSNNSLSHPLVGDVATTPTVVPPPNGCYSQTGVTGALPSTWTTGTTQGQAIKLMIKFSSVTR